MTAGNTPSDITPPDGYTLVGFCPCDAQGRSVDLIWTEPTDTNHAHNKIRLGTALGHARMQVVNTTGAVRPVYLGPAMAL